MIQVENVIYPMLLHSLTIDGLDAIEEGIDCITIIVYWGYKNRPISPNMWKLYPQLLYVCAGTEQEKSGGFGLEYISQVVIALKNYISRDSEGLKKVGEGQEESHLHLLFRFIKRILEINANGKNMCDGVTIMGLIVCLLENMINQLDNEFPTVLDFVLQELNFCETNTNTINSEKYKSMILQALAMCFNYNAALTFQLLESKGLTL